MTSEKIMNLSVPSMQILLSIVKSEITDCEQIARAVKPLLKEKYEGSDDTIPETEEVFRDLNLTRDFQRMLKARIKKLSIVSKELKTGIRK